MSKDPEIKLRQPLPTDEVWDACARVLGYEPATESEKRLWGKMIHSLYRAGATDERIDAVARWYHKTWPNIDLTVTAIEKWYSHFLRLELKREKRVIVCDACGVGGGHHTADCYARVPAS